jgi:uncharacterized protein (DUF2147 family)
MKKLLLFYFLNLFLGFSVFCAAEDRKNIVGFWKTINETTLRPESIVAIYRHNDIYYGRIIMTYNDDGSIQDTIYQPNKRAIGIAGNPYYVGLDIIWGLKPKGSRYLGGSVVDPKKGNIYGAEVWRKGENLIVRGKLFIFGRNQIWPPAIDTDFPEGFIKPDFNFFVPIIPKAIK